MKEQKKPKPIPMAEIIAWVAGLMFVTMFAAIGLFVTIHELIN